MKLHFSFLTLLLEGINCLQTFYVTNYEVNYEKVRRIHTTFSTRWSTDTVKKITLNELGITNTTSTISKESDFTTTITSTLTTYTTLQSFPYEVVVEHNSRRQLHKDTPDLLWSDIIAQSAQQFANEYSCDGILVHSGNPNYGENLALGYKISGAINAWYDEIDEYDYNNPVFGHDTGHFTQVVWKSTTYIGCGIKYCDEYYGNYTVCQYWPPGNYKGQFSDNVMSLRH